MLCDLCPGLRDSSEITIVVAHPDDEVIGAGGQLSSWPGVKIVHVTDGAPTDMKDASDLGFSSRKDYALARRQEAQAALSMAGVSPRQVRGLGFVDQELSLHLVELVQALCKILSCQCPAAVLTHPYEGGHPDHDATAFAVHSACARLRKLHQPAPAILEFTSYHNRSGIMQTSEFLPRADVGIVSLSLGPGERCLKKRMLDCFATQQKVLRWFPIEMERFRVAPSYDFSEPPHSGKLYYELFDWGMTGERWRPLACGATSILTRETAEIAAEAPPGRVSRALV